MFEVGEGVHGAHSCAGEIKQQVVVGLALDAGAGGSATGAVTGAVYAVGGEVVSAVLVVAGAGGVVGGEG